MEDWNFLTNELYDKRSSKDSDQIFSYVLKFESFKNTPILQIILHDRLWNQNKDTPQIY